MLLRLALLNLFVIDHAVSWRPILTLEKIFKHLTALQSVLRIAVVKNASRAHI